MSNLLPERAGTALERFMEAVPEGGILRAIALTVAVSIMVVLALDYHALTTRPTDALAMPESGEVSPVTMERPGAGDQLRRYLPYTRPAAPDSSGPRFPGRKRPRIVEAARMEFSLGAEGEILAAGTISVGSADEFQRFLAGEGAAARTVVLHSPGGHVQDAMEMARTIRDRGLATVIASDAYCASSCPLLFAAGVERTASPKAWIGVHQVYALESVRGTLHEGMRDAQLVSAECQDLLSEFGVDVRVWTHAMRTPKEQIYFFTAEEMTELALATKIATGD